MPRALRAPSPGLGSAEADIRAADAASPDEQRRSQRQRLVDAMIDVAATSGYAQATVARVSLAAGVSSQTFYECFRDREDCLLAAYRVAAARLLDGVHAPGTPPAATTQEWRRRACAAVEATLKALASDTRATVACA